LDIVTTVCEPVASFFTTHAEGLCGGYAKMFGENNGMDRGTMQQMGQATIV
jgi:hypothetical protein